MARTDKTAVRLIIDTEVSDDSLDAFIGTANIIVTNTLGDSDLTVTTLTEIEKWISAHLTIAMDPEESLESKKVGKATSKYTGEFAMGLQATRYGQMAIALDTTGTLLSTSGRKSFFECL